MAKFENIKEHMEVLGSDGQHVGTVDHLDGADKIKLAKSNSKDGKHHFISVDLVEKVELTRSPEQSGEGRYGGLENGSLAQSSKLAPEADALNTSSCARKPGFSRAFFGTHKRNSGGGRRDAAR